jgi:regulator of protease activity HflC (stomatin/prohibitin superfamily)
MRRVLNDLLDALFFLVRCLLWGFELAGKLVRLGFVRRSARIVAVGALHAALFIGISYLFLFRVTVGQIGVRQAQLGTAGVEKRDRGPGLHPSVRWLHAWHVLDARLHVAAFGLPGDPLSAPALELRTEDGNRVTLGATVVYRIRSGEAWRLVADGLEHAYRGLAQQTAESVLRSHLAQLDSDDFASTDARNARMAEALPELNAKLLPLHLEAEAIQIQSVAFYAEYEKARANERLTREEARHNEALTRLERARSGDVSAEEIEAEEKRIRAEALRELAGLRAAAQLEIARLTSEADSDASRLRSDADATYEAEVAAGELALARAEAERELSQGAALAGEDGRVWLAREAAARLKVRRAELNASDPRVPAVLDLDAMVRLLLGSSSP